MRKMGLRALAALFCAGLTVSVALAAEPEGDAQATNKSGWWPTTWFAGKTKSDEKTPAVKADALDETSTAVPKTSDMQLREQKAYFRRLAACDRLAAIALQNNDQALQRQVEELQAQVFEVYMKRVTVPVGGAHFEADGFTETRPVKAKTDKNKTTTGEDQP